MKKQDKIKKVGIIMNGVTGRMGTNQHLMRSILPIIQDGGIRTGGITIMPDPVMVGRNEDKLRRLSGISGIGKYTTDLQSVLTDPAYEIYFDACLTSLRTQNVRKAVCHNKHIYCEKPVASDTGSAMELYRLCKKTGVKHGVVQDKLWLPGLVKLRRLKENDFFGRILSVKGDFGYWVFEGHTIPAQRPSWNYRKEKGGGIILDMLCHWRYVLDNLIGNVQAVSCTGSIHIPERIDESGKPYRCTAEDTAYANFRLDGGILANFVSSWTTRVRRDDLLTLQVDGTRGSAVAGLRKCYTQHYGNTPRPVWNPDVEMKGDYYRDWSEVPGQENYQNAFRAQWELFLRHVALDQPFQWDLLEGARGVQLAELGYRSWNEKRWVEVEELKE